jgi:hypothetical protein
VTLTQPISVVIPTYNRAGLVGRAVESALRETRSGDEVIVVDDGSADATALVLETYRDRIRYVAIPNGGAGRARNRGVREARNSLVAFLDSDDEWMPGRLALRRSIIEARPDVLFCFSDFAVRDYGKPEQSRYLQNWHRDERPWNEILGPGIPFSSLAPLPRGLGDFTVHVGNLYAPEMSANYVFTSTIVARREAAGAALWFAEDLPLYEDWVCFGRLARAGLAAYLDCETAWQYGHAGPRLTGADRVVAASARLAVLKSVWGADAEFLAQHRAAFERVSSDARTARARALIAEGRTPEARIELELLVGAPWPYRLLAALPGRLARLAVDLSRGPRAGMAGLTASSRRNLPSTRPQSR